MLSLLRARVLRFLAQLWVYLVLALLLTTIMVGSAGISDRGTMRVLFIGNLLLSLSIGASMELGLTLTLHAPYAKDLSRALKLLVVACVFGACVIAGVEFGLSGIAAWAPENLGLFPEHSVWMISVPVSLAMMGLGFLHDRVERAQTQKREVQKKLDEMRLVALSTRTEPHFLFNALNTIAALVQEDSALAERALLQLSALFRFVLEGSKATLVSLHDELTFTRSYVEIESLRFGERLNVRFDVADGTALEKVPPFVLQPLVENAVRHGLSVPGKRTVSVTIRKVSERLELCVDDDGPGPQGSEHRGATTTHHDLRQRLTLLYGDRAQFVTGSSPLGGFRACVTLPAEP